MKMNLRKMLTLTLVSIFAITAMTGILNTKENVKVQAASNLIVNGGFENDLNNWQSYGSQSSVSTSEYYAGLKSFKMAGTGGWGYSIQTVSVTPNTDYEFNYTYKSTASYKVGILYDDNGWKDLAVETTPVTSQWTNRTISFNSGNRSSVIIIMQDAAAGVGYFDELTLSTKAVNLLANPGFESDLSGWTTNGSNFTATTAEKNSGSKALKVVASATWNFIMQELSVTPNTDYSVSFYYKGTASIKTGILFTGNGWEDLKISYEPVSSAWKKAVINFNSASYSKLILIIQDSSNGTNYYDDISFSQTGSSPQVTPVPTAAPTTNPTSAKSNKSLGTNLCGVNDWSDEMPFKNIFKLARPWNDWIQNGRDGITFDADGYPINLNGKTVQTLWARSTPCNDFKGNFLLLYDGEATIDISGDASSVVKTPGRISFTKTTGLDLYMTISYTNPNNHVNNIRLIKSSYENDYLTQPFTPQFISKIVDKFGTLRFMDWMDTNNSTVANWSDKTPESYYTYNSCKPGGVPIEVMVKLCNQTKSSGWFNMPHQATDDYITKFAGYVKNNLDPSLKAYVEYSNECWNGQFEQEHYCSNQASKLGVSGGNDGFYAKRTVEIMKLWESVYGGPSSRYVRVLSQQADWGNADRAKNSLNYQFDSKKASYYIDALAIAPYFGGSISMENPATITETKVLDLCESKIENDVKTWITAHMNVINNAGTNYNNKKLDLIAYEGGQHLSGYGNSAYTTLFTNANRNTRMGTLYTKYLNQWKSLGGKFFCVFSDVSAPGVYGMWGFLESMDATSSAKYDAILAWMDNNPTWW